MKRFYFLLMAAGALFMASCEQNPVNGDPPQISTPETSIAAPGNGGTVNFAYSITNAAADGKLTAEMAEWMHNFTAVNDTLASFSADPNDSGSDREGKITLIYTYGGSNTVTAEINVTQTQAGAEPTLTLGEVEPIPAEGGLVELTYTITDPVENGEISAATEAGWISDFDYSQNGVITFTAAANDDVERSEEITVTYEYDGKTIEATATITQESAGSDPLYDYEYEFDLLSGTYYGTEMGINGEYNYYTWISDLPFADGYTQLGGTYYLFDIFNADGPADASNPLPTAGTYVLGEPGATSDMTFTPDYSQALSTTVDNTVIFDVIFTEGTLEISYEGDVMTIEAVITDNEGKTHHVTYTGTPAYDDATSGENPDNPDNPNGLGMNLDIQATTAVASYVTDNGSSMQINIQLTDMPLEGSSLIPPGSVLVLELIMPFDDSGNPATGTYTINETSNDFAALPGSYIDFMGYIYYTGCYVQYTDANYSQKTGLMMEGEVQIDPSGNGFLISCSFTADDGSIVTCEYDGPITISGIPGPYSTLTGDYTVDFEGATGYAEFYGDYYGTGGSNWVIQIMPTTGNDGFMTEVVCSSTTFANGITSGIYSPSSEYSLYPGEYATGYMASGSIYGTNYLGGFDDMGYVSQFAPAISGDMNIVQNDDGTYTISFAFLDDKGNTWDGEWSGAMDVVDVSYAPARTSITPYRENTLSMEQKAGIYKSLQPRIAEPAVKKASLVKR